MDRQDPNPTADRTIRPASRGWRLVLGTGLVAVVFVSLLGGRAHDVGYVATMLGAAGAAAVPWLQLRRRVPASVLGLAAGLAAVGLGDATYTAIAWWGGVAFPSPADVAYLTGYGILVLAIARLYGRRPTTAGFVDAAILTLAGALVLWVVAVEPAARQADDLVSTSLALAYPAVDVLYLGLLAGLLIEARARSVSLGLALGAIGSFLVADTIYAAQVLTDTHRGGLLDALWSTGSVLLAAAANHPSLLTEHRAPPLGVALGPWRFHGLFVAALTAPALTAVRWVAAGSVDPVVASLGAGVLTTLVFVRLGLSGRALTATIASLAAANARIRHLEGILPICASCKRIRDEEGRWTTVERFLEERSPARFSHGLCDDCLRRQLRELE